MNSVLDSPLEALAFNYVTFGFSTVANNLWTLVAVVTAAVSFWRLRLRADGTAPSLKLHSHPSNDVVLSSNESSSFPEISPPVTAPEELPSSVSAPASVAVPSSSSSSSSSGKYGDDEVLTKGVKFTQYFDEDIKGSGDMAAAEEAEETSETEDRGGENWWESDLRMRTGEKSWYRCQDLTVFNGNVVRLWDYKSTTHRTAF